MVCGIHMLYQPAPLTLRIKTEVDIEQSAEARTKAERTKRCVREHCKASVMRSTLATATKPTV